MPTGRPSILTPELIEEAGRLASIGFPTSKIAQALNIGNATIYRWLQEAASEPEDSLKRKFRDAIHRGFLQTGGDHLQNLRRQSADGSTAAATWFLTHHPFFRDDFSDAAAERRAVNAAMQPVMKAIATLPADQRMSLILAIEAEGGRLPEADNDSDG